MDRMRRPDLDEIEAALDQVAEWLVALYGTRIVYICLTLEGFYGPGEVYWGLVTSIERADGESRETLPSPEVRGLAEGVFPAVLSRLGLREG